MSDCTKLYAGGLAETVSQPTLLTYSFLKHWFTTSTALGKALEILHIPHIKSSESLVILNQDRLYVDLDKEEHTIYLNTLFSYKPQKNPYEEPVLSINPAKLFSLKNILNTLKILFIQSTWIASPTKSINIISTDLQSIPDEPPKLNTAELDEFLAQKAWPLIIATGILAEYFAKLFESYKLSPTEKLAIQQYISHEVGQNDWIINSVKDMNKVKSDQLSFANYMKEYGLRADQDYELASPRWYEIPWEIQERIKNSTPFPVKNKLEITVPSQIKTVVQANIELQILRTQARKKTLPYIDLLRRKVLLKYGEGCDFNSISRESLLFNQKADTLSVSAQSTVPHTFKMSGKGLPVSAGFFQGKALNITSLTQTIPPNTISIFPNASPEYSIKFPACAGIIFQAGGQTSHGAIVSREYAIPALVDSTAQNIPDNALVNLNGTTGEWKIIQLNNQ